MPVDQPGGIGTKLTIYDDSDPWLDVLQTTPRTPGPYSFAEVYAGAVLLGLGAGTDISNLTDVGINPTTNRTAYWFNVDLQIGDTGTGTATTTLQDTNVDVMFAGTATLTMRTTQTTSWNLALGTKVGTYGAKNGCTLVANNVIPFVRSGSICKLYDCEIVNTSASSSAHSPGDNNGSEILQCEFKNTSTATLSIGGASNRFTTISGLHFSSGATSGVAGVLLQCRGISVDNVSVSVSGANPRSITGANNQVINETYLGTPSSSDLRWSSSAQTNATIVRPTWSQNGAKFSQTGAGSMAVANGAKEYRSFNVKVVDAGGAALSNIPVKVTDTLGNVQVNTTTDSNGRVSFGSAPTANMCIVMDHYTVTGTYNQRHRGPFLFEYNTGNSRNTDYQSLRGYAKWPGHETVTTTAGTFEDLNTVVHLQYAAGAPTTWVEREMP